MNIFKNFENLVAFPLLDATTDFQRLAKEISGELGGNKFLLNNYLSEVFDVLNCADLQNASFFADSICWTVLGDCYSILEQKVKRNKSKYFELVEKYINENPTDIKHVNTKAEFYASEILFKHINIFSRGVIIHLENKFTRIDFSDLNNYYRLMANLLGKETMKNLNDLICPAGVAFIEQISSCCIGMFLYRDRYFFSIPEQQQKIPTIFYECFFLLYPF